MLSTILLIPFILICLALILIVLLQAGKGGGLAGAFGGGGGQTFLGARGAADFLGKMTIYLAVGFMVLALILSMTYGRQGGIKIREEKPPAAAAGTTDEASQTTEQAQPAPAGESSQEPASQGDK